MSKNTKQAVIASDTSLKEGLLARPVIHGVEQHIRAEVGNEPGALGVYGLKPIKQGKKTAQVKAQAVDKAKATRKKNNTMGASQRKTADKAAEQAAAVPALAGQAAEVSPNPAPAPQTPPKQ